MGFSEEALKVVKNILDAKLSPDTTKFEGRFFPIVVFLQKLLFLILFNT